ncbi:MAG TPA: sigma-70 family RNA polymerase sigma factor [Solirubrobacterales bacterium]|jgi:RNA polymerase sigma factor (sigma-70 family)|nr:sigma-70 family RNA polymerase sigma factor [Solirubrobacterales bacterium]
MPPPPADSLASRLFVAPALRTQPDRRLVSLVREGYELAFEEIVRRYRAPLERFAAAIVGSRSEDVTQDAFSKALLALRGSEAEIELRPWLYRIVRNAALNDIRDSPPPTEELGEGVAGGPSAAVEAERREEMSELTERLRALPETQRAAIVMRELEGLSHEEIAAALGVSGGAARQAIHRARSTLRDGVGLLLPVPLLRLLLDHGGEAAAAGAASATGGSMAALGGLGAGGAAKIGVAAVLVVSSVGAGVAVEQHNRGGDGSARAAASSAPLGAEVSSGGPGGGEGSNLGSVGSGNAGTGGGSRGDAGRRGGGDGGAAGANGHSGPGSGGAGIGDSSGTGSGSGLGSRSGSGSGSSDGSGSDGRGSSHGSGSGRSGHGSESGGSGHGSGSGSDSGSSGSGGDDSGSGRSGSSGSGSSGGSGSTPGGSGSSDDSPEPVAPLPPVDSGSGGGSPDDSGSGHSSGGSGSGGSDDLEPDS